MELLKGKETKKDNVMNLLSELKVLMNNSEDDLTSIEGIRECFMNLKEKFTNFIQCERNSTSENEERNESVVRSKDNSLLAYYKRKNSNDRSIQRTEPSPSYGKYVGSKTQELTLGVNKSEIGEKLNFQNVKERESGRDDLGKRNFKEQSNSAISKPQAIDNQKQVWDNDVKIERAAFEVDVRVGQLYDVKTETLSSQYLFSDTSFHPEIEKVNKCEIKISNDNRLSSRFRLFDIEPEQQLSIILNSSNMDENYGKYLVEENFQNTLSETLFYKYTTLVEKLTVPSDEIRSHINSNELKDIESTYVVVGIIWGVIRTLTLEHHSTKKNHEEIENLLNKEINYLKTYLETEFGARYKFSNYDICKNLILKIDGNIQPFGNGLKNLKFAIKSISSLPNVLENRKGSPLKLIMAPLSSFVYDKVVHPLNLIDVDFVKIIVHFFEKLTEINKNLYDLEDKLGKYFSSCYTYQITNCKKEIDKIELELKQELRAGIPKLKSGELEIDEIVEVFLKYENRRLCCENTIDVINSECSEEIFSLVDFCLVNNITFLDRNEKLSDFLGSKKYYDFYVLYMSLDLFNANAEIALKTCNLFVTMAKNCDQKTRYVLVDLDVNFSSTPKINQMTIMYYKGNTLISSNVVKDLEDET